MNHITLGSCPPDILLSHLALYGLAAILQDGGITGLRATWKPGSDTRPQVSAPALTGDQAAETIARHAVRASDPASWLHRAIVIDGKPRALMSPRLTAFADDKAWQYAQQQRHQVLDELTDDRRWLDLRFLAALGEPCYWIRNSQGRIEQDNAASRLEMQPRNSGSEFVGTRLRKLAAAVAARDRGQILSGLTGQTIRDEIDPKADSRTATGLAAPGPTDNVLAWCALWGISQLPLALRARGTAATSGHLGRDGSEWFYAPIWHTPWRPARMRTILNAAQVRIAASHGLDSRGRELTLNRQASTRAMVPGTDIAAAHRWLSDRSVTGIVRFPIQKFDNGYGPERRAMRGTPLPIGSA